MRYLLSILLLAGVAQAQELPESVKNSGVESFEQLLSLDCVHPDGFLFRDHWLAAGYTVDLAESIAFTLQGQNFYLSSALSECLNPPQPEPGPKVSRFLWKPRSEGGGFPYQGKVVVLTSPETNAIVVNGEQAEELRDFGPSNGYRSTSRSQFQCSDFKSGAVVQLRSKDGLTRFQDVVISNPCSRKENP